MMESISLKFKAGSPIVISGPTGVGKTRWVYKLLTNNLFSQKPHSVLYCYGTYQSLYDKFQKTLPNITFEQGIPSPETIERLNDEKFHVIVLDDLMEEVIQKGPEVMNLFTKLCHHYNITAIFVTQNVFAQGKYARSIALNTHYLVLFENKRDESQMSYLARQLSPNKIDYFLEAYDDAVEKHHGYLLVDCEPQSPRELKLRTNIFPSEDLVVYFKKK